MGRRKPNIIFQIDSIRLHGIKKKLDISTQIKSTKMWEIKLKQRLTKRRIKITWIVYFSHQEKRSNITILDFALFRVLKFDQSHFEHQFRSIGKTPNILLQWKIPYYCYSMQPATLSLFLTILKIISSNYWELNKFDWIKHDKKMKVNTTKFTRNYYANLPHTLPTKTSRQLVCGGFLGTLTYFTVWKTRLKYKIHNFSQINTTKKDNLTGKTL